MGRTAEHSFRVWRRGSALLVLVGCSHSHATTADGAAANDGVVADGNQSRTDAYADGNGSPTRRDYVGTLDAQGNATLSPTEITIADMPITIGYVHTTQFAQAGYVPLGNIIPGDGAFRFQAGAANANAAYVLVTEQ